MLEIHPTVYFHYCLILLFVLSYYNSGCQKEKKNTILTPIPYPILSPF